jgi:hypothetical protein
MSLIATIINEIVKTCKAAPDPKTFVLDSVQIALAKTDYSLDEFEFANMFDVPSNNPNDVQDNEPRTPHSLNTLAGGVYDSINHTDSPVKANISQPGTPISPNGTLFEISDAVSDTVKAADSDVIYSKELLH